MKSQTSLVARSCRIQEWAAMVQECKNRPEGMSVDEWCHANNITVYVNRKFGQPLIEN